MVRLIGKNKSVLKSAGSVSAGNKSVNDLLVLFEGFATAGSITGIYNMKELYNDVLNSDLVLIGSKLKYGHSFLRKIYAPIYKKKFRN